MFLPPFVLVVHMITLNGTDSKCEIRQSLILHIALNGVVNTIFSYFLRSRRFLPAQTKRCLKRCHVSAVASVGASASQRCPLDTRTPTFYKRHYRNTDSSATFQFAYGFLVCILFRLLYCRFQKHFVTSQSAYQSDFPFQVHHTTKSAYLAVTHIPAVLVSLQCIQFQECCH